MEIFNVQIYYKEKIMPTRTVTFKTEKKNYLKTIPSTDDCDYPRY